MKYIYPIIIQAQPHDDIPYLVLLPDFDKMTQACDLAEAVEMGQDLLENLTVEYEDENRPLPPSSSVQDMQLQYPHDVVSLVVANPAEYRERYSSAPRKKTLTIPAWLNSLAEKENINFSQTLQDALKEKLNRYVP